jgi:DNA replication and repair protein RecF
MVKKLWTKGFRNLEETVFEFSKGEACFILGDNNQGKTNFLESLYVLGNGVSPTGRSLEHVVNFNQDEAILGGDVFLDSPNDSQDIELKKRIYIKISKAGDKTAILNNKQLSSFSEIKSVLNIDFISADVLHIFQENAGFRRKALDRFCSRLFPAYQAQLKRYERVLSQKNVVLKSRGKEDELTLFNSQLVKLGSEIYKHRLIALNEIELVLQDLVPSLILDSIEKTDCSYVIHRQNALLQDLGYEEWLDDQFHQTKKKEREIGFSLVGVHRDDFNINLNGKSLYSFYSRGINRSVAILVNVAQLIIIEKQTGAFPVLLLDDTFAEIDATRKKMIVRFLEKKAQLFYCSVLEADKSLFENVKIMGIKQGQLELCTH